MAETRSLRNPAWNKLNPRLKFWLEGQTGAGFCTGMCAILQAVSRSGSIKQAADKLGKSYRHVWGRIKAAERVVGQQLVETRIGGKGDQRSALTAEAEQIISHFLAIQDRVANVLDEEFRLRFR